MDLWRRFKERTALFLAAIVLLDPDKGLALALRNCIRLDGRWHPQRWKVEIQDLLKVMGLMVGLPLLYLIVSLAAICVIDQYVVPLPFVLKLTTVFHLEEEAWEANIEKSFGSMEGVAEEYEAWGRQRGMSAPTAKLLEKTLWHGWPVYLAFGLFMGGSALVFCIRVIVATVRRYRRDLTARKERYYDSDLEVIPRHRILF